MALGQNIAALPRWRRCEERPHCRSRWAECRTDPFLAISGAAGLFPADTRVSGCAHDARGGARISHRAASPDIARGRWKGAATDHILTRSLEKLSEMLRRVATLPRQRSLCVNAPTLADDIAGIDAGKRAARENRAARHISHTAASPTESRAGHSPRVATRKRAGGARRISRRLTASLASYERPLISLHTKKKQKKNS